MAGAKKENKVKKLYRSGDQKVLGGVCGGIAEYLNLDPVIIRLGLIALTLFTLPLGGISIVFYLLAWILIPRNPKHEWN